MFSFSVYRPSLFKHFIFFYVSTSFYSKKLAAVRAIDEQLIAPRYNDTNFCPLSIFLHQTWTVRFVKHLSPYTGCIAVNMICMKSICRQK